LAGSIASMMWPGSIDTGSGSCTKMPSTASSALRRATSASSCASLVVAGSLCSMERMPAATVWRALLAT